MRASFFSALLRYFLVGGWILVLHPPAFSQTVLRDLNLFQRDALITGSGLDEPYSLPDDLLIEGSETVVIGDSILRRERDYQLDAVRGILRFRFILSINDTARVRYQVFPFELRSSFYHSLKTIRPEQAAISDTLLKPALPSAPLFDTGSLRKSGTLVRGITIGSDRDLSVQSGLNLQVEGRLGRDVDVLALLSDQNTPIQPEGNTATLQEIDKVLVQVRSPHFDATLGDYELQFEGPRYGTYFRKLQGACLEGRTVNDRLILSGAVSKGQYFSNYFQGQEGNQGPYRLTDKEGRSGILVLAGTERVWVDGIRQTRGENNDYTIEYGLGEITFTPRRLITSDSRITVDFQYSADEYGRDIYAAQGEGHLFEEKLGLRTTFISEADAKSNPLAFVLTDSARKVLSAAGDDPQSAQISSVDSVAVGAGSYIREEVSWGGQVFSIYTYVGPDSIGYLNIVFSYVGSGSGDYVREAGATGFYYRWAGPGEGDYAPVQRLPLPQRQRLADGEIWVNPTKTSSVRFEGAVSDWDRNTYSSLDDHDNVGFAWVASGSWSAPAHSTLERTTLYSPLTVQGQIRRVEDRFAQIDRMESVEYNRDWDLQDDVSNGESVQEATVTVRPAYPLTTQLQYGRLKKESDGFRSERWRGETTMAGGRLPSFNASADWIRSHSDFNHRNGMWTRGQTTVSYTFRRFTPQLRYEREHKRDDYPDSTSGFLFNTYEGGLFYETNRFKIGGTQELRLDQVYRQSDLRDYSSAWTQQYNAGVTNWKNLTGDALYKHRVKTFEDADSGKTVTDLAEINLGWTPFNRSVDLLAHYRISNTQVSTIVQIPVYVGPGQGTHVKVGDLFFEDPDGDYIIITQPTGQFQPVIELDGSLSLNLDPHRLPEQQRNRLGTPWRHLASETTLNFSEKTRERDVWAVYLLDFSKFQGDSTLAGNILLREDLFLFRHRRDLSFRLRWELAQSLSNLYLSGGQESRRRLISLRIRRAFGEEWSAQMDLNRKTDLRIYRTGNNPSRDIASWGGSLEPSWRPTRFWEISVRWVGQQDHDRAENLTSLRYGAEPRIVRSFTEKGRAELRGEWHHVAASAASLPYEMADGDPPGDNFRWDLRLDYRLSKYLTGSLSYTGSKDAGRDPIHIGRAEVRAFF